MNDKPYHHGDLKNQLIEKGLELIAENGLENLSLRKTAERCGVSVSAPYAHFRNKDDLVNSIRAHAAEMFMNSLNESIAAADDASVLVELGKAYVLFFLHSPLCFELLFSDGRMHISSSAEGKGSPPFELFSRKAYEVMQPFGLSEREKADRVLAMWGMVHGLTVIALSKDIVTDIDWEERIGDIIGSMKF